MNHIPNLCQGGGFRKSSKPVHTLRSEADTESTGDDGQLFVGTLFTGDIQANDWQTKLKVNDTPVTFKLDTGAQANVLPVNVYRRIQPNKPLARASSSSVWRCKDNTSRRDTATSNLPCDRKKSAYEVLRH